MPGSRFFAVLAGMVRGITMSPAVVPISGGGRLCAVIFVEIVKNLEPDTTRERQKMTQNGAQIEINPAENGWELNISKKLQTQKHPSP